MTVYVFANGKMVEKWSPEHLESLKLAEPSHLPCPTIRTDGMEPIRNHADGRMYDSKSAYYGSLKSAGYEIVANEPKWKNGAHPNKKIRGVGADIARQLKDV